MIEPEDICMLVFTSALNLHERALSVQNTWLKDFPCGYLVGGNYIDTKLRMISAGENVGEDYSSAADKQYLGLKKAFELHPDKKWFYITGCDAFIYSYNLCTLLSKYNYENDFFVVGHARSLKFLDTEIVNLSGGAGFALSNSLALKIVSSLSDIYAMKDYLSKKQWNACDMTIAYFIEKKLKINPTICDGFSHCQPYHPESVFNCDPVAYHMINIREMYSLYSGKKIKKPNILYYVFDKIHVLLAKKLKTKKIVNVICKFFYGK